MFLFTECLPFNIGDFAFPNQLELEFYSEDLQTVFITIIFKHPALQEAVLRCFNQDSFNLYF